MNKQFTIELFWLWFATGNIIEIYIDNRFRLFREKQFKQLPDNIQFAIGGTVYRKHHGIVEGVI